MRALGLRVGRASLRLSMGLSLRLRLCSKGLLSLLSRGNLLQLRLLRGV